MYDMMFVTAYLLNTQGCKIPLNAINYNLNVTKNKPKTCHRRAIYLSRTKQNQVRVSYQNSTLQKYLQNSEFSHCCYRFIKSAKFANHVNNKIT